MYTPLSQFVSPSRSTKFLRFLTESQAMEVYG